MLQAYSSRNLVRENDYQGFLSCLLFPAAQRDACFSILAFKHEMKSIRKQCNNNLIAGRMRFQWWRSLLDDIYIDVAGADGGDRTGKALSQHPVVEVLSESVMKYSLTKRWLERILESQQMSLDFQRPQTMSQLEDIAENSHSTLLYLQNELLRIEGNDASYAASHFGVCSGLVSLLKSSTGSEFGDLGYIFPSDVMAKHNLSLDGLSGSSDKRNEALIDTVHDIASQAYAHLERGKELQQSAAVPIYPFLSVVPDMMYLESLKTNSFDIVCTNFAKEESFFVLRMQLNMLLSKMKGRL